MDFDPPSVGTLASHLSRSARGSFHHRKGCKKLVQIGAEYDGSFAELPGLEAAVCYRLVNLGASDTGNAAGLEDRKTFTLKVKGGGVHECPSIIARSIASVIGK
jgi:hypothetical protein